MSDAQDWIESQSTWWPTSQNYRPATPTPPAPAPLANGGRGGDYNPPSSPQPQPAPVQSRGGDYDPGSSAPSTPMPYGGGGGGVTAGPQQQHLNPYTWNPATYRQNYQNAQDNPFDPNAINKWIDDMRYVNQHVQVMPGVRPTYGYMPGVGGINLNNSFRPTNWDQFNDVGGAANSRIDPVEAKMMDVAQQRGAQFQPLTSWERQRGLSELPNFGRGFRYGGAISPQQQQMEADLLAGRPVNMALLAKLRSMRMGMTPLSNMQQIAKNYYAPALAAMGGVAAGGVGGIPGALLGAGWGTFTSGAMTKFKDPAALAAGGVGGFAGGYGGNALGGALNAGPVATGALAGAGGALGRNVGRNAVTGDWNLPNMGRDVALGGIAGGVGGALRPAGPIGPNGEPGSPAGPLNFIPGLGGSVFGNMAGNAAAQAVGSTMPVSPGPRPAPRPAPSRLAPQPRPQPRLTPQQLALRERQKRRLNPYSR